LFEEEAPEGWEMFSQPGGLIRDGDKKDKLGNQVWIENPEAENIHNLPDNYYKSMMAGKSEDWIAVNLGNEYGEVNTGKPVYPEYRDSVHCVEDRDLFDPSLPIGIGWDFGLTPVIVLGQLTKRG
jgi:hypothetical protein